MKKAIFFLLLAVNLFAINCGDFTGEFKTYNGHYYAITGNKMSFQNAKNFAQANNGYLAIPNTLAENNFIKGIVGSNNEAWIGIYDPNYTQSLCFTNNCYSTSRSRFKTVQGTSLSFQNWDSTDIENQFMENDDTVDSMNKPIISLLGEHWALLSGNTGKWRDWGTHFFTGENPAIQKAMIEFDTKPTCYEAPSPITGEITGRVCNSQVWDTVLGVSDGTTAQCLSDVNNVEYCPQSLAQCGSSWDYDNGYSVSGVGSVTDYTNKVSNTTTTYSSPTYKLQVSGTNWDAHTTGGSSTSSPRWLYASNGWYTLPDGYSTSLGNAGNFSTSCISDGVGNPDINQVWCNGNGTAYIRISNGKLQVSGTSWDAHTTGGSGTSTPRWLYASNGWYTLPDGYSVSLGQPSGYMGSYISDGVGNPDINQVWGGGKAYIRLSNGKLQVSGTNWDAHTTGGSSTSSPRWLYASNGWYTLPDGYSVSLGIIGYMGNFISDGVGNPDINQVWGGGKAFLRISVTCSTGTLTNGQCATTTTTLNCPSGYTATTGTETAKGQCKTNQNYTYYTYLCNSGYTPISSGGNTGKTDPNATTTNTLTSDLNSSTPPLNNCKKERFTCLANAQRPCALVDNKMQCSPFPCVGSSDFENLGTVEGQNDKNNSGWNNEGSCAGQLYIFNGEDKRCRLKDKFFGLTGGGCCDKDKVFMGLIACKDNEKILAKKRNNDLCHYVGQYCSKKLKFLGCIQTSESYCCFSSKLGRIIHEQGRPQLGISWGSGDSPNCRGFTPDEFQKLDFSKLDFTEFAKDIQTKTTNFNNIGGFIQNKVQGFYQQ